MAGDRYDHNRRQMAERLCAKGTAQSHDDHNRTSDPERRLHQP